MTLINAFQPTGGQMGQIDPYFQDFSLDVCSGKTYENSPSSAPSAPVFEIQEKKARSFLAKGDQP